MTIGDDEFVPGDGIFADVGAVGADTGVPGRAGADEGAADGGASIEGGKEGGGANDGNDTVAGPSVMLET